MYAGTNKIEQQPFGVHQRDIAVIMALDEGANHIDYAFYCAGWLALAVNQWW